MNRKLESLKLLIQNGMSSVVKVKNLVDSAKAGDLEIVKYLLDNGVDINSVDRKSNTTAVTESSVNLHFELTEYLIERGVDLNVLNNQTLSYVINNLVDPINNLVDSDANKAKTLKMVQLLLKSGANDKIGVSLFYACKYKNIKIVKLLIEGNFTDIHAQDDRALIVSLQNDYIEIVKYLISSGANINAQNGEAIRLYIISKNYRMLKYIIQHGANIQFGLFVSVKENNFEFVKLLVDSGANVNMEGILNICVLNNNIKMLEFLLKHGSNNIDFISMALLYSVDDNLFEFAKLLIEYGADVNYENSESLIISASKGNINIVEYLVDHGVNINAQDNEAFKISKKNGHSNVIEFLTNKSNRLYENISSVCNSNNLTDKQIDKIGKVLNLKDVDRLNLCNKIHDLFKEKSEKIKSEQSKCKTETTLLGTEVKDLHPMVFHILRENNNLYCGDIREFIKLRKNPYTNNLISPSELKSIRENYIILTILFKNIEDIEEKNNEIIDTIEITVRKAISNILTKLRYPNNAELYVNSTSNLLDDFINKLKEDNILTNVDVNNINKINVLSNKKLILANVLNLKLESDTSIVIVKGVEISTIRVTLEEIYNSIFN